MAKEADFTIHGMSVFCIARNQRASQGPKTKVEAGPDKMYEKSCRICGKGQFTPTC